MPWPWPNNNKTQQFTAKYKLVNKRDESLLLPVIFLRPEQRALYIPADE